MDLREEVAEEREPVREGDKAVVVPASGRDDIKTKRRDDVPPKGQSVASHRRGNRWHRTEGAIGAQRGAMPRLAPNKAAG
jgi:hypothetical protein